MHDYFVISSFLLLFSTFSFGQTKPLAGSDRDSHDCIGSAGYTFSKLKNDCVRPFEQKIQLKEVNPAGSSTSIVAVIFSNDGKKAEIFMPGSPSGIIMNRMGRAGGYIWKKGDLSLSRKHGYLLKRGNKLLFDGA